MTLRLARVGRIVCALVAAAILFVPLGRACVGTPLTFCAILALIAGASALRPAAGAVMLAAALPLSVPIASLLQTGLTTTGTGEAFVLAFLAGGAISCAFVDAPKPRLAVPALAMAIIVALSMTLEVRQWQRKYPVRNVPAEITRDVMGPNFLRMSPEWPEFRAGLRWLEGLALAVLIERALRRRADLQGVAVRIWLVGGAAAASLAVVRLAEVSIRQESPFSAALQVLRTLRVTTMQPDLNAAGSYFVLLLLPALVIGLRRRSVWMLGVVAPLILVALLMTHSLAALLALVAVGGAMGGVALWQRQRRGAVVAAAIAGVVILVAGWAGTRGTHAAVGVAARIRVEMARVAVHLTAQHPILGVGVGRFVGASRPLISTELAELFPPAATGENAHNNFLQILAELGFPGLIAFCAVFVTAVRPGRGRSAYPIERAGLIAGLTAFGVTMLLGHPLLIAEVSVAFFLVVGLTAGLAGDAPDPAGAQP